MTYDDVEKVLAESSQDDWAIDDATGSYTYKDDLNLCIKRAEFDDYEKFNEPWAVNYPDKEARAIDYTVTYSGSFVKRERLVDVDGSRAILPMPTSQTDLTVSKQDVNFAKIVDIGGRVDEYLKRSKIEVKD